MGEIAIDIPQLTAETEVSVDQAQAWLDATRAAYDAAKLAAECGISSVPFVNDEGQVVGIPALPGADLAVADLMAGTSTGGLLFNVKAFADLSKPIAVTSSSGALTLFATGLVNTLALTENITAITASALPEFAMGVLEITGHASNSYTINIPTGGNWFTPGNAASFVVSPNTVVTVAFRRRATKYLAGWDSLALGAVA